MITIDEIAKLSGVSKSTVSRVLNNNGYVSISVRKRVEKIICENNYSPSAVAVNLSRRETNAIGVVIPELDNTFFGEVLKGITEVSDQKDYSIICCDTANSAEKEGRALRMLEQQRVRGLIITPAQEYSNADDIKRLQACFSRLNIPIVVVDRHLEKIHLDGVYYENFKSGFLAASELIKAGNKRLGIITGDLSLRIARERYQGFSQAMADFNLEIDENLVLKGDFGINTAYNLAKGMFKSGSFPEGIVTCNNRTSLGFIKAARECNVKIGRDIAMIGIDGIQTLDILGYNFSCVTRDTYEMGRSAMRLLSARIENEITQLTTLTIPCRLVLKGSEYRIS
jgi:LacI family transcriptional regulator